MTTHGMHGSPTYNSWRSMKARCLNPNDPAYHNYGGRGVTVDPRWYHFIEFLADMGVRPEGTELDREKNDLGYYKENCRWVVRLINSRNRRTTVRLPDGRPLSAVAAQHGLHPDTLKWRLDRGLSMDEALVPPGQLNIDRRGNARRRPGAQLYEFNGERLLLVDIAERIGIPASTLSKRMTAHPFEVAARMPYQKKGMTHANET